MAYVINNKFFYNKITITQCLKTLLKQIRKHCPRIKLNIGPTFFFKTPYPTTVLLHVLNSSNLMRKRNIHTSERLILILHTPTLIYTFIATKVSANISFYIYTHTTHLYIHHHLSSHSPGYSSLSSHLLSRI